MMTMVSSRNPASTSVLSAIVVLATTPSSAHRVCCGSTRSAVASLSDWWSTQTMSSPGVRVSLGRTVTEVDVDGTMIDVEVTFCYLGELLCSGGGCDSAIAARCCATPGKFRKLLPVLTSRHLSHRIHSKVTKPAFTRPCSMIVKYWD